MFILDSVELMLKGHAKPMRGTCCRASHYLSQYCGVSSLSFKFHLDYFVSVPFLTACSQKNAHSGTSTMKNLTINYLSPVIFTRIMHNIQPNLIENIRDIVRHFLERFGNTSLYSRDSNVHFRHRLYSFTFTHTY